MTSWLIYGPRIQGSVRLSRRMLNGRRWFMKRSWGNNITLSNCLLVVSWLRSYLLPRIEWVGPRMSAWSRYLAQRALASILLWSMFYVTTRSGGVCKAVYPCLLVFIKSYTALILKLSLVLFLKMGCKHGYSAFLAHFCYSNILKYDLESLKNLILFIRVLVVFVHLFWYHYWRLIDYGS